MKKTAKKATEFSLKELNKATIAATKKYWKDSSPDEEAFEIEMGMLFDYVIDGIDYRADNTNKYLFYGIFESGEVEHAEAFVELIIAHKARKGTSKMVKLWTNPKFWDMNSYKLELSLIFITALEGILIKGIKDGHNYVKIYARNDYMMAILNNVYNKLSEKIRDEKISDLSVSFQGRWLVFESN